MRSNKVRERLIRGETVFGPLILELFNPGLPQIFASAGADFVMYDQEAGCLDISAVKTQIALCRGLDIVPLVNVPGHDHHLLVQPLDCGAMGLLIPVVQSKAEAEAIVRITHYPPQGVRGVAFGIAHDDYLGVDIAESIKIADDRTLIAAKIETTKGVEHVDEIVSTPGIDVAFVGHMDLSVSLGIPGQYEHERFTTAVDKIITACKKHSKAGGCLVTTPVAARQWMAKGFRFIIYSTDVILLASAFKAGMDVLKGH